jgi:hypothetical protein
MPGFLECIEFAWHKEVAANQNPLVVLHIKLSRAAKALRAWSKTLIPQGKLALVISREIILQLEKGLGDKDSNPTREILNQTFEEKNFGVGSSRKK